ncbi:MAG: hypothetical protein GXX08_00385 [Firmicutes bacterium]|nr:hypothetical protein [Bacillota bacterium]
MNAFPRTTVGGVSVSRMIIGTNWFFGYSHRSPAQDALIVERVLNRKTVSDILQVFFSAGVDTIMGPLSREGFYEVIDPAIKDAEDRTGVQCIRVDTPEIMVADTAEARSETERMFDRAAERGARICMPHHSSVEQLLDRGARTIRRLDDYIKMIKDRSMVPGLSAHMPEVVVYADAMDIGVETYIQIYNPIGFLMQLEVEAVHRVIWKAKKPVMTIKPMAAGRVTPFVGLSFVWNTIRDIDMVTVGTMSPREAAEVIEISMAAMERRLPDLAPRATTGQRSLIGSLAERRG